MNLTNTLKVLKTNEWKYNVSQINKKLVHIAEI